MDYTNVLQLVQKFCDRFESELAKNSLIGISPWQELFEELQGIRELLNDPVISQPLDNYKIERQHPVDKYGVASIVLALYEDGVLPKNISEQLVLQGVPIEAKDVKSWLKAYEDSQITDKIQLTHGSVFDTQNQLQSIFDRLHNMLGQVEIQEHDHFIKARTTKEQVLLDYAREIRQSVKDASALAATVASMQSVEQFKKIVIEEINKESPAVAQRIWKAIRGAKANFTSLNL